MAAMVKRRDQKGPGCMQVSLLTATAPVPAGSTVVWILVTEEQTQRSQWTQEPTGSRSVRLVTNVQVGRPCIRATTPSPLLSFCVIQRHSPSVTGSHLCLKTGSSPGPSDCGRSTHAASCHFGMSVHHSSGHWGVVRGSSSLSQSRDVPRAPGCLCTVLPAGGRWECGSHPGTARKQPEARASKLGGQGDGGA